MKKKIGAERIGLLPGYIVKKKKICIARVQLYCDIKGAGSWWSVLQYIEAARKSGKLYCNTLYCIVEKEA